MSDDLVKKLRDWRRAMYNTGWLHLADSMEAVAARIEELENELHIMKTAGIVEVSVRNPSVMEYMKHWEGRAEAAEAKLAKAVQERDEALNQLDSARHSIDVLERRVAKLMGEK